MRPLSLALLSLGIITAGCGALEAATTLTLGAGDLPRIEVDHRFDTAPLQDAGCAPAALAPLEVTPVPGACRITAPPVEAVLVDQEAARNVADQVAGMPPSAVKTLSLVVEVLSLTDGSGAPLPLEGDAAAVSLTLDGVDLFAGIPLDRLQAGGARVVLPEPVRARFAEALVRGEPLAAAASWSVDLPSERLAEAPDRVAVAVVLQPEVEVDLVDAAPALFH